MIIIHAADLHLGSPLGGLDQHAALPAQQIRSAPLAAFQRIAELCEQREADLLLIAGDVFDGDASHVVIREAASVLRRIAAAGTSIVTIRGNHDAQSRMQRNLPLIERVYELSSSEPETLEFEDLGVAVHGRGFDTQRVPDNIVTTYPARIDGMYNIGMLHTSLEGNAQHASYAPCHVDDLVAHGYDYWALGHIHQHAIVRAGDPWIVFAGSPQGRHIGEIGAHGVYVLDVQDGALATAPEHVELAVLQWHHVRVNVTDEALDADAVCALAGAKMIAETAGAGSDVLHVVRMELTGRCAAHLELMREPGRWREALVNEADAAGCHLEKTVIRTAPVLPSPEVLLEQQDFIGTLARYLASDVADAQAAAELGAALPVPAPIERLDTKLRGLGGDGDALRGQGVTLVEREAANDELLARLVVAVHEQAEEDR
ncbi:MAG: DNA repair exonuclease [Gaiellales bacterium]